MLAKLKDAVRFMKIIDSLQDFIVDVNMQFMPEYVACQCIDRSHICLVHLILDKKAFTEYDCESEMYLGINIPNLISMFRIAGKGDTVTLRAEPNSDVISLFFENTAEKTKSDLSLKLMDLQSEEMDLPDDEEYSVSLKMSSAHFSRYIKDLSHIGDEIKISVTATDADGPCIVFSTLGDIGGAEVRLEGCFVWQNLPVTTGANIQFLQSFDHDLSLSFAARHLVSICKASSLNNKVVLRFSRTLPLLVNFVLPDMGFVKYFMAPKVDNDNDEVETDF